MIGLNLMIGHLKLKNVSYNGIDLNSNNNRSRDVVLISTVALNVIKIVDWLNKLSNSNILSQYLLRRAYRNNG